MTPSALRIAAFAVLFSTQVSPASPPKKPAFDTEAVYNPNQPEIGPGAQGPGVVRAQILLARAHFSCGEIDGDFGSNLQKTVAAYQADRHLSVSGGVDAATWTSLNADQVLPLTPYTITADDEKGPFIGKVPPEMMQQAKLPSMGYTSPLQELSARFHASPRLMQLLNPGADFTKVGQELTVPNVFVESPGPAAEVDVSKSDSSVRAIGPDGKLLAYYSATIGSEHDPLPVGAWKITGTKHDPVFHYDPNLFWNAKSTNKKTDIQAGPNNPVGLVWIDLSKEHYGIHGTPDPSLIGHAFSHGCIRLTNWDALELASMVKPGTPAILKE